VIYYAVHVLTCAGVRRGSVPRDLRRIRHPNVRVHSHDPIYCRRPLPPCGLSPAAELSRGEGAGCRQRRDVKRTRCSRRYLQFSTRPR